MSETTSRLAPSPRERRFARTRLAILDAALKIINFDGLSNLSMRRLARDIDYSPAALYEYFRGKEDIISALCERVDEHLAEFLDQLTPCLSPEDRLVEIGMNYLEFARCHPAEYGMLFTRPFLDSDDYGCAYLILLESARSVVKNQGMHAQAFAYSCWALVHGMAVLSLRKEWGKDEMQALHRSALQRFIYHNGKDSDE